MHHRHFSDPHQVEETADALRQCCVRLKDIAIGVALYGQWFLSELRTLVVAMAENPVLKEFENSFDNKDA